MAKTMKALVKSRPEVGIWMENVPVPEPGTLLLALGGLLGLARFGGRR